MRTGTVWSPVRGELTIILGTRPDVLSPRMMHAIEDIAADWRQLDGHIERRSDEITALGKQDRRPTADECAQHRPIISTAIVAAIGTGDEFSKGRDFPAPIAGHLRTDQPGRQFGMAMQ